MGAESFHCSAAQYISLSLPLAGIGNGFCLWLKRLEAERFRIQPDASENAIRPFVIGRKNWLFSDPPKTPRPARSSTA